jgi:hypothetical protein
MKRFASSLLVLAALVGATVLPSSASAASYTRRGNVITPNGFCAEHADGTRGVRFDTISYSAFLAEYAADRIALAGLIAQAKIDAEKNGGAPMTELQIGQLQAKVKKEAAALQRMRVDQGQVVLCK